ncbi:hypothetical protein PSHT_11267 [Puccinia striiformis]|uniref:18S rRNA factor 2 n=1 Tax=Puccinia striiformis TaxID=27350 RepID=A0A2S4V4H0_9BASI|nr:hypothetical protein PSHT_11267 [Puccinia striiformis]
MAKRKRQPKLAASSSSPQKRTLQSPNRLPSDGPTTETREPEMTTGNSVEKEDSLHLTTAEPDTTADILPSQNEKNDNPEDDTINLGDAQEDQVDKQEVDENDEEEINENQNDALDENSVTLPKSATTSKVIDLNEIKKFGKKIDRTGLVYLSRIPPGMGPSKLKHLLSKWGEIGRIYLARDEKAEESKKKFDKKGKIKRKKKDKHQSWVEFMDKKVARRVAEMLNTRPIGGKASDRYYSDLWTLTYLPKFKWTNLSDQIAIERRIKEQLVRNSLEESKLSQEWYLGMVEKNSTNQKIIAKQLKRQPESTSTAKTGKPLEFKQRELPSTHNNSATLQQGSKLKSVLEGLF